MSLDDLLRDLDRLVARERRHAICAAEALHPTRCGRGRARRAHPAGSDL